MLLYKIVIISMIVKEISQAFKTNVNTKGIRLVLTSESEQLFHVTLRYLVHIVWHIIILIFQGKTCTNVYN